MDCEIFSYLISINNAIHLSNVICKMYSSRIMFSKGYSYDWGLDK